MTNYQGGDVLCVGRVTADINECRLNDEIAGLRLTAVTAVDDVGFKNVVVAQNALLATDVDQGAQGPATSLPVGEIIAPAA